MGLVTGKTKPWLEAWNFQPLPPFSGEGREAASEVNNPLCLHDEASMKVPKVQGSESF